MILYVHNYIFFSRVLNDQKKVVCIIKNKRILSAAKKICNQSHKIELVTDIVNEQNGGRKYVVYSSAPTRKEMATATPVYAADDLKAEQGRFPYKLPQVQSIKISSVYGKISINRLKNSKFSITDKHHQIGEITFRFPFQKCLISIDFIKDQEFGAALYVLLQYMIHEDDLIIV